MEEMEYRKYICSEGHVSSPYKAGDRSFIRCAECGQPFERRSFTIVNCFADGSVPEENETQDIDESELTNNSSVDEDTPNTENNSNYTEAVNSRRGLLHEEKVHVTNNETQSRRKLNTNDIRENEYIRGRGQRSEGNADNERGIELNRRSQHANNTGAQSYGIGRNQHISSGDNTAEGLTGNTIELALYNGGMQILIPSEGGIIGREGIGQNIFAMNNLVSRKHASIKVNRLGLIQLKDEGSLNGTYVDDGNGRRRLKNGETAELKAGNTIWIANVVLAIEGIR